MRALSEKNKTAYRNALIGKSQTLLIEKVEKGIASGYGELYVPIEMELPVVGGAEASAAPNSFAQVRITSVSSTADRVLTGEPLPDGTFR